jgi:hypothetical protein
MVVLGTAAPDNALILCRTPKHKHLEPQQIHLDRCNLEACCILEASTRGGCTHGSTIRHSSQPVDVLLNATLTMEPDIQ